MPGDRIYDSAALFLLKVRTSTGSLWVLQVYEPLPALSQSRVSHTSHIDAAFTYRSLSSSPLESIRPKF